MVNDAYFLKAFLCSYFSNCGNYFLMTINIVSPRHVCYFGFCERNGLIVERVFLH